MAFRPAQGLLLMPDISGYTRFISSVELLHSQHIVAELLGILIDATELHLELSEIEGDALLFHGAGDCPTPERIIAQATEWVRRFHEKLNLLKRDVYCTCGACQNVGSLSLKVVGHYGEIGVHRIGRYTKLVGVDVVLAHRLLKNRLDLRDYLLLTEAALPSLAPDDAGRLGFRRHSEAYPVFGTVPTLALDLASVRESLAPPSPRDPLPEPACHFEAAIRIQAPLEEVIQPLTQPERWPQWLDGLESLHYDTTEPLRSGHSHVCVIEGRTIHQTLEHLARDTGEVTLTFRMKPPMGLLRSMYRVVRARQEAEGTYVSQAIHCERRPLLSRMFELLALPMLRTNFQRSLRKLKTLVESEPARTRAPAATEP